MLHHISFGVSDIERAAAFYDAAFAPLGYVRVWEDLNPGDPEQAIGYGPPGGGDKFAIKLRGEEAHAPGAGFHLAFAAPNRDASFISMQLHWLMMARTTGRPVSGRIMVRLILPPSSSIRMGIASRL